MKMYEIIEKLGRTERPAVSFVGAGGKTSCILELADDWAARGKRVLVTTTVHMERPEILGRTGWIDQPAENIRKALESPGVVIAGSGSETWEKIRGLSEAAYTEAASKAQAVLTEADGSRKFPVKVPGKNEPVKNPDLWKRLLEAKAPHQVEFIWVKGHDGHPQNERCDTLATQAADGEELAEDEGNPTEM